jgi:hypothetical protein
MRLGLYGCQQTTDFHVAWYIHSDIGKGIVSGAEIECVAILGYASIEFCVFELVSIKSVV